MEKVERKSDKNTIFYGSRSFLFSLNLEVSSPVAASLGDGAKLGLRKGNVSQNVLPLTSAQPLMAFKHSVLHVPYTFCENQMSSVSPWLPCGQSVNCKSLTGASAAVRARSFSVCKCFPQITLSFLVGHT